MSCRGCEARQELHDYSEDSGHVYVRVGNGNVELVGCVDHVRQLVAERRAPTDLGERAQKALDAIEGRHIGHREAGLALQFTKALFVTMSYLNELEELAAEPPEPTEPAADCLNCDGSGCDDCRPRPDVLEWHGTMGDGT